MAISNQRICEQTVSHCHPTSYLLISCFSSKESASGVNFSYLVDVLFMPGNSDIRTTSFWPLWGQSHPFSTVQASALAMMAEITAAFLSHVVQKGYRVHIRVACVSTETVITRKNGH